MLILLEEIIMVLQKMMCTPEEILASKYAFKVYTILRISEITYVMRRMICAFFHNFIWCPWILEVCNCVCDDKWIIEMQQATGSQQMAGYPSLSHPATYWVQPRLPGVRLRF